MDDEYYETRMFSLFFKYFMPNVSFICYSYTVEEYPSPQSYMKKYSTQKKKTIN